MTVPFFVSVYFWHYSAAQRAAQNAARFMATISKEEMRSTNLALAAEATAIQIAQMHITESNLSVAAPFVEVNCNNFRCTGSGGRPLPTTISVGIKMDMADIFGILDTGRYGIPLTVEVVVPYIGN
jgi:hypothetical protein